MSYDLYCFQPVADEPPLTTVNRILDAANISLPSPEIEARKQAVATCLRRVNPMLEPFQIEHDKIAELEGITVDEARGRYRYIELNTPEVGFGIQLTVYDYYTSLTVPYWHKGRQAEQALREIGAYLTALKSEFSMVAYDPQLENILTQESDLQRALTSYLGAVNQLATLTKSKRPWWKFW